MKLSDIEYQADNTKATFYYSADDRVDFRELIKLLAGNLRSVLRCDRSAFVRKQVVWGVLSVCGRELCCSTWLSDFKNGSNQRRAISESLFESSKLSGQCGRLKCCLNYELETYMEALEEIPKIEGPLLTEKGTRHFRKPTSSARSCGLVFGGEYPGIR